MLAGIGGWLVFLLYIANLIFSNSFRDSELADVAFASNLFGITCVAMVKIRSVRPYKRLLILESQAPNGGKLATAS